MAVSVFWVRYFTYLIMQPCSAGMEVVQCVLEFCVWYFSGSSPVPLHIVAWWAYGILDGWSVWTRGMGVDPVLGGLNELVLIGRGLGCTMRPVQWADLVVRFWLVLLWGRDWTGPIVTEDWFKLILSLHLTHPLIRDTHTQHTVRSNTLTWRNGQPGAVAPREQWGVRCLLKVTSALEEQRCSTISPAYIFPPGQDSNRRSQVGYSCPMSWSHGDVWTVIVRWG